MIGVVLWSDPLKGQAVFWCEDHGDLAYFSAGADLSSAQNAFAAGDMVQFEVTDRREYREAVNASLVRENVCRNLQKSLHKAAGDPHTLDRTTETAKVIALNSNERPRGRPLRRYKG